MDARSPKREPSPRAGPHRHLLWGLVLAVLALHGVLLVGVTSPLQLRLTPAQPTAPVQLRVLAPAAEPTPPARPRPSVARSALPAPEPVASEPDPMHLPQADAAAHKPVDAESLAAPPASAAAQNAQSHEQEGTSASPQPAAVATSASAPEITADHGWPLIPLGDLPPSSLVSYALSGMDKGFTYHANGELRWQHNSTAYELTLTVRAFLLGSRHWRSVGSIEATGLAPTRFSDSWRNERAAHFDRERQRLVFSSNSTPVALQAGAQDQVSLYVQLAAAMNGEPERFVPGTRLQVQTVTVRDAQPWSLTLDKVEALQLGGRTIRAHKWVCQPRNLYEARVEFWLAAESAWLPVRILITQNSGSYIDLQWRGSEPLAPLAPHS